MTSKPTYLQFVKRLRLHAVNLEKRPDLKGRLDDEIARVRERDGVSSGQERFGRRATVHFTDRERREIVAKVEAVVASQGISYEQAYNCVASEYAGLAGGTVRRWRFKFRAEDGEKAVA